jgi:cell wall-associated NlpC family hydrolase
MSATRFAPARLLTTFSLVLGLAFSLFAFSAVGPTTSGASALITAQTGNAAVDWARSRKGSPYAYGAAGPHRFDCSGLTRWVFAHVGKSLPHSSSAQAGKVKRISRSNARRGDLVFFYGGGGIYHVGIYAGRGQIWHASVPGTPVKRDPIWSSNVFFGRVR